MRVGEVRVSKARCRVELDGTGEELHGLLAVLTGRAAEVPESTEGVVPRREVAGRPTHGTLGHALEQLRPQRHGYRLSYLVAGLERVVERRRPPVRPDVAARFRLQQLGRDPHAAVGSPQAAHDEVLGVELLADRDRGRRLGSCT